MRVGVAVDFAIVPMGNPLTPAIEAACVSPPTHSCSVVCASILQAWADK